MLIGGCASQQEATFFNQSFKKKRDTVVLFPFKEATSAGPRTTRLCKGKDFANVTKQERYV